MKAVIYARYSSDNQREESIDAQLRACREYCIRQGYDVVGIYTDQALTATTDDRPEFQRMVTESHGAGWDAVVVHKLDRFARNRYDAAIYKKKLRMNGTRLVSVLENLDDSPESVVLESVLEGMAEYYSRNLSREVKKGLRENAYQKRTIGGFPPLGYDLDADGHYVVNEKEAAVVKLIFAWAQKGWSYRRICETLNLMGEHSKIGNEFVPNGIHDILRNEKYRGTLIYNRFKRGNDGKVRRHALGGNPDTIIHEDAIQALVPEMDWYAVNDMMDQRRRADRTQKGEQYLLTGKLYCGICGGALSGHRSRNLRYYKCCRRKSRGDCPLPMTSCPKVDCVVVDALKQNILNRAVLDEILPAISKQATQRVIDAGYDHEAIRERLQALEQEITRVVDAIVAAGTSNALNARLKKLEDEKKVAMFALVDAESTVRKYAVDMEGIREMMERDIDALDGGDPEELRRIIQVYVDRVVINPPPPGKRTGHKIEVSLRIMRPDKKVVGGESSPPTCPLMAPPRECFQWTRCYTTGE